MEKDRERPEVKFIPDIEELYKKAIEMNIQKRDKCSQGTKEWEAYNKNIMVLEKQWKKLSEERKIKKEKEERQQFEKKSQEKKVPKESKQETKKQEKPDQQLPKPKLQRRETRGQEKINYRVDNLIKKAQFEAEAQYRGNWYLDRKYDEAMKRYKSNIIEKRFQIGNNRGYISGTYKTVKDYPNRVCDEKTLNFQQYRERLERVTKAQSLRRKGIDIYKDTPFSYKEDIEYLRTNNYTYSQYNQTKENLKTLGYFGKKSRLLKLKKGQNVRNIVRTGINITGYIRNHTIVPVSNFIGENVAVKVYDVAHKTLFKNKNGVYKNRRTHRYEARKQYFLSQGKGYIKSVYYSIRYAKKTDRKIIKNKQQEIKKEYENYRQELLKTDRSQRRNIRRPNIKTDPISEDVHNRANKKNVTRVISGIKMITIAGISYIGPKISKIILDKTSHERILTTQSIGKDRIIQTQKLVPGKSSKVIDREKLENLRVKDLIDLNDNKVASYAGGAEKEFLQYVRGIAEDGISMADRNVKNAAQIVNGKIPERFLTSAGNLNKNTKILDLIAANRNQSLGTNISKKQILDEIFKSGKPEDQMQKLQEMFNDIHLLKATNRSGNAIGWNSLGDEFANIKQGLYKVINEPPNWITVTKKIKGEVIQEISKGRENSIIVQRMLSGLGNTLRAARVAEVIDLIYENSRKTTLKRQMGER